MHICTLPIFDILDKDGNISTRRWFDENGNAIRDVDMTNHGNPVDSANVIKNCVLI